ncbi:hypothetical protein [Endozoicomonas montiporae]|nr:hypothetical protein [Endozoicomonas montiporae]
MYRITTILLFVLLLAGCDQRTLPPKNYKLDEGVMTLLLDAKEDAIRRKDAAAVRGFYSKHVVMDITGPKGQMFQGSYKMVSRQAEINAEYGRDFYSEILERVVYVSANQDKAIVQQRIKESWLFNSHFNDVMVESINRMEWELVDNVPQITRVSKRILDRKVLNEVDRQLPAGEYLLNDA